MEWSQMSPDAKAKYWDRADAQTIQYAMNTAPDPNQATIDDELTNTELSVSDTAIENVGSMILAGSTLILGAMIGLAIGAQRRDED